jgi:3-hydroxyanthranilate 3,4-dioxygenase
MGKLGTINFSRWLEDNRHLLKPPVGNKNIYNEGGIMMFVVGGPNERTDWHLDPREEFFYQIEGDMTLKVVEDGEFRDLTIAEGEIFLLPPMVPHSPQRPANTIGVVIEYARPEGEEDGIRWYCQDCGSVVYEQWLHITDLTTQLAPVFDGFYSSIEARTCPDCGALHPTPGA